MSVRTRRLVPYIMSEVSSIPDHDIFVLDRFPVNPAVEASFVGWTNSNDAVLNGFKSAEVAQQELRNPCPRDPSSSSARRITGMRLWMGLTTNYATSKWLQPQKLDEVFEAIFRRVSSLPLLQSKQALLRM